MTSLLNKNPVIRSSDKERAKRQLMNTPTQIIYANGRINK
jgi:hypothetical protein